MLSHKNAGSSVRCIVGWLTPTKGLATTYTITEEPALCAAVITLSVINQHCELAELGPPEKGLGSTQQAG